MNYYKLLFDYWNENDKNIICCAPEKMYGFETYSMNLGKTIDQWNDDITFQFDPSDGTILTDYLATSYPWFIVSDRFRNIMAPLVQDSIQYLRLKVHNRDTGEIIINYQAANVISIVDALDLEHSDYSVFTYGDNEKFLDITKYAIKGTKTEGNHIFKLKEETVLTVVSEAFKHLLIKHQLTGFLFREILVT